MRRFIPVLSVVMAFHSLTSAAEPSSQVAWTADTLNLLKQASLERGRIMADSCEACHAATDENAASDYPYLAGQRAAYLFKQLRDYKNGNRINAIMTGMAAPLSNQAMADIAAWYSQQVPAVPVTTPDNSLAATASALVARGDPGRLITPCSACHTESADKPLDNPVLAGQKAAYLEDSLLAYQTGHRHNDTYQRMRLIANSLTRDEIHGLAVYYASRTPSR